MTCRDVQYTEIIPLSLLLLGDALSTDLSLDFNYSEH